MKLIPIEFNKTKLSYGNFLWKLPKSRYYFLIIEVKGELETSRSSIELRCLYNHIEELRSQDFYFSTIILDFTELKNELASIKDLLPTDSDSISSQVGIITQSVITDEPTVSGYTFFTSLEKCLSRFSFENRKLRFDGGKNVTELPESHFSKPQLFKYESENVSVCSELFYWNKNDKKLFLLKFKGDYPHGSQGANEGKYIGRKIRELVRDFNPVGLIIDFSELVYEWGDDIEIYPWQFKKPDQPIQFIFSEKQIPQFRHKLRKDEIRISSNFKEAFERLEAML